MEVNKKRIVVNTLFLYGKTLITIILSFMSTRLILEGLGVEDFGIYGTVGGAIVMLESLNGAMAQATQRYMNYAEGKGEKDHLILIFNNTMLLHIIIGVLILLAMAAIYYPLFNGIFNIPSERIEASKYIYMFLAVSTFFTIVSVPYDAVITAHEDFLYYSIVNIIVAFLKLGAALAVIYYLHDRLILYGFIMAAIAIVNMIIMLIYCHKKYGECCFAFQKNVDITLIKEIGAFAGWNFVGSFAGMAGNHGSTILMNHFFGPILITAKNIGDQICTQVAVLTNNMTKALNPVIVKSEGGGDRQGMIRLSFYSCRFSFLLYLLLAIPFLLNTESLLALWLKNVPDWAVLFCQLQVLRTLFEQISNPLRMSLMAQGSIKFINIIDLILSIVTFFLLWFLYSIGYSAQWHYYISIFLMVFVAGGVRVYLCYYYCEMKIIDYFYAVITPSVFVTIVSFLVALILQNLILSWHAVIIASVEVLLLMIVDFIFGLNKNERKLIVSKAKSYISKIM